MARKYNKKQSKKIRNLVAICSLCAIMLSVSTYAWFIGMKTVNVNKFEIEIATTEGLMLSLDGKSWKYQLNPNTDPQYDGNTNQWLGDEPGDPGLIPMSSVGDMDSTSSTMKLFQKGSLTATPGGYRLMASRVKNYEETTPDSGRYEEGDGYIAFDLFIMNLSGDEYYQENNPLNEEAIYLTTNSEVKTGTGGVENTGIENSVRVGFAQIGRVSAELDLNDTTPDNTVSAPIITGITCAGDGDHEDYVGEEEQYVTGICRNATIWEPNDAKHVQNAANWYQKSCLKRTGATVTDSASYTTACDNLVLTQAYPTYAISNELNYDDEVNVYDGNAFNTYTANTVAYSTYNAAGTKTDYKLVDMTYNAADKTGYFTDTMKGYTSTNRPQFMTLAPNSITKVRVYVWLEGQDVDNYDFASLGQQISINFGFTKERYTEGDIDYDGPSTDITPTNGQ